MYKENIPNCAWEVYSMQIHYNFFFSISKTGIKVKIYGIIGDDAIVSQIYDITKEFSITTFLAKYCTRFCKLCFERWKQ
jgi:hypothetical protein